MSPEVQLLKGITALLSPLGLTFVIALLGLALRRRVMVLFALGWLWLFSAPQVALWLGNTLEYRTPIRPVAALPSADLILVLGGASSAPVLPWFPEANLRAAADRYVFAAKLWHAGKAPRLLFSGGSGTGMQPEAVTARELWQLMGLPDSAITLEPNSRTTRENAAFSVPLIESLGSHRVLVVTSAWHMPRALLNLHAAGPDIEWLAAPCDQHDFEGTNLPGGWWWPNTEALDFSRAIFKEWLGIAWAKLGGR